MRSLAVICTHGRPGHVAAALEVAERDEAPVALHPPGPAGVASGEPPEIEMADGGPSRSPTSRSRSSTRRATRPARSACTARTSTSCSPGDALVASGPVPHEGEFPDFAGQLTAIGEHLLDLPGTTRVLPGHGQETHDRGGREEVRLWVAIAVELPA